MSDEDNPFDVNTVYDTQALINDIQGMCRCEGSGVVMGINGPTDCEHIDMHSYVGTTLKHDMSIGREAIYQIATYERKSVEQRKWIDTLTGHLDAIARIANERPLEEYQGRYDPLTAATAVLNEIRAEVLNRHEETGLASARAGIMRDMARTLHHDMGYGICICGEAWDEKTYCSEMRRILSYADKIGNENG